MSVIDAEAPAFRDILSGLVADALRAADASTLVEVLARLAPDVAVASLLNDVAAWSTASLAPRVSSAVRTAFESPLLPKADRRRSARLLLVRFCDILDRHALEMLAPSLPSAELDGAETLALERALARFPKNAILLRAAAQAPFADGPAAHALLDRLGDADPSAGTIAYVRREREKLPARVAPEVKIALASSYTIDFLMPYLDFACHRAGLAPVLFQSAFNSWAQDILDASSPLRAFDPDITFLSLALDDLFPELANDLDDATLEAGSVIVLERIIAIARHYTTWAEGKPLVVHSLYSAFEGGLGIHDGRERRSRHEWVEALNASLGTALRALPGCYLLDISLVARRSGTALADNPKLRHMASLRLPAPMLDAVARAYLQYVVPLKGLSKKCVVLDLDNTLWGGVVGEDSKDGIRLGNASPGSEFVEFQGFLKSLTARGILLAVNSKNNPEDALDVIRTHEAMVLRESDFSAIRINWLPKSENMISIASELNIGVDALVFVDDNPDERERMRQLLPSVLTVEMPRDPSLFRSVIERLPELQTLAITNDDGERVKRYRGVKHREAAKSSSESVEAYLQSLKIVVTIGPATKSTIARVAQLFAKTNQFNATTRRYSLADVDRFTNDPEYRMLTLQSRDHFGEHGLVAVALVRVTEKRWTIDSFLMSCRVIGYGIESALLAKVAHHAREAGANDVCGEFIPTAKNAPASDLFARHGFTRGSDLAGVQCWELDLTKVQAGPSWINVTVDEHVA